MKKIISIFTFLIILINVGFAQNGGYAVKFNGTDGSASHILNSGNTNNTVTFECWFSQVSAQAGTQYIADLRSISGTNNRRVMPYLNNSILGIYCAPNTGNDNNAITQSTGITVTQDVWYHIAVTINGSTLKMYVNGKLYITASLTDTYALTGTEVLTLGSDYANTTYANIKLDEARVWSIERTEAQIKANMSKELAGNEAGLLAYYKMSNGSGTTISHNQATGAYDGTLSGGASWITSGAFASCRNALDFDGMDDYVDCGNSATVQKNGTQPLTVEAWVKPTANVWGAIISKFQHESTHEGYSLEMFSDRRIVLLIGNNWTDWNLGASSTTTALTLGEWSHIAATYDGATVKIYINGKLDASGAWSNGITDPGTNLFLGSRMGTLSPSTFFSGQIDEARVWTVARTEAEIRETMMRTLNGNEAGLAAYYKLDNVDGTINYDLTANGNNGTLTNMDPSTDWVSSGAFNTWLGSESNSWTNAVNWSSTGVPSSSNNVGIYKWALGNELSITGNPTVQNILFSSGASPVINSNFTVTKNLITEKNTDINGKTITLGSAGNLVEGSGYLYGSSGTITTTRSLSSISSLDVAGLGAQITTTANMGSTTITRGHTVQTGNGNNSIKRYYDITPTNNSGLNATLVFNYRDNELNGLTEANFKLFKSTDAGTSWADNVGTLDAANNKITKTGIASFSRWTIGDAAHSLAIPTPVAPVATAANLVTTTSFSANWNASANATKYYLDVATDNAFTSLVTGYNNLDVGNVLTYSVTGLSEGATYYYRVRAYNISGTSGNSNTITQITIPTAPIATAAASITTNAFSANWNAFAGATGYYLDIAADGAFTTFLAGYNNKDVGNVTTLNITGLTPGSKYYYRVRSYNGGGTSDNSNIISVYLIPETPVAVNAANITTTSFTANWNTVLLASIKVNPKKKDEKELNAIMKGYLVDVATDPAFANKLVNYDNKFAGDVTSIDVTGLSAGNYYYRVRARNSGGKISDNSNVITVALYKAPVISYPNELNFGDVAFASEPIEKTITVGNSGDANLKIENLVIGGLSGLFEVLTPIPIVLEPGTQSNILVRLNPVIVGNHNTVIHIINNSAVPDAALQTKANISYASGLGNLEPREINYGTTSKDSNNVTRSFYISNNSNGSIQITGLSIAGDSSSFIIMGVNLTNPSYKQVKLKAEKTINSENYVLPITLNPGQSYEILVKFLPQTIGAKFGSLKVIMSDGKILYARLYGIAQGAPEMTLSSMELNYGELNNGSYKVDSIVIKNTGTLNLNIKPKSITGDGRAFFSIISGSGQIALKAGETEVIKVAGLGVLPVGAKSAEIVIMSDDPVNQNRTIRLTSTIRNGVITAFNLIEFDTTDIDVYCDTTINIKNDGNKQVTVDGLTFDGAYASDFSIVNSSLPINLNVGEEKQITIRFSPKYDSLRYARLVIHTTDQTVPFSFLVVKGYGIKIQKTFIAKGRVLFHSNGLNGVTMTLSGDQSSAQRTDENGNYSYSFGRMKSYTITPSLSGFIFNPKSKSYSNVLCDEEYNFEAINESPAAITLIKPENNKLFNMIYPIPTAPVIFGWNKTIDPEGILLKYKLNITGNGLNKVYSDIADTVFSADIMKDLTNNGTYLWSVETSDGINITKSEINTFRTSTSTTDVEKTSITPVSYELSQNYPNPFNPETVIKYSLPENVFVTIKVYNTVGKEVEVLVNGNQSAGTYQITWHPKNEPSGVYYYKITAGNFKDVRKMVYMR